MRGVRRATSDASDRAFRDLMRAFFCRLFLFFSRGAAIFSLRTIPTHSHSQTTRACRVNPCHELDKRKLAPKIDASAATSAAPTRRRRMDHGAGRAISGGMSDSLTALMP